MKQRKKQTEPHLRVYSNRMSKSYPYPIGLNSSYGDMVLSKSVTQSLTLG